MYVQVACQSRSWIRFLDGDRTSVNGSFGSHTGMDHLFRQRVSIVKARCFMEKNVGQKKVARHQRVFSSVVDAVSLYSTSKMRAHNTEDGNA